MQIFELTLDITGRQKVMLPAGAKLLNMSAQPAPNGSWVAKLWALADEKAPAEPRFISIYQAGDPMPDLTGEYITTFTVYEGLRTLHAFDVTAYG